MGLEHLWTAPIEGEITELREIEGKIIATIDNVDFIVPIKEQTK